MIYDAEKHINLEKIRAILQVNRNKKIICFGGGTASDILMEKVLYEYDVDCFLDNNSNLYGNKLHGIEIKSPDILTSYDRGSFIILILSKHVSAISNQLLELGLRENVDFYDVYNMFIAYFRIKKYEKYALKFIDFIERIPDETFDSIPLKDDKKIGIVVLGEMIKNVSWYSMAQSILLRFNGYASTLIIDTIRSFDSYIYFDGIEAVAKIYIDYVVKVLQNKCPDIDVKYIDAYGTCDLDEEDILASKKYAPIVVKWFDSRRDEVFIPDNENRIEEAEKLIGHASSYIKAFLDNNHFEVLNVYTGVHRHRCAYAYLCETRGVRMASYDGDEVMDGIVLYSANGISGEAFDVTRLVKNNPFSEEIIDSILQVSKEHFNKRFNAVVGDEGYNYQTVSFQESIRAYDVVVPFNIFWDSAALTGNELFKDEIEWLRETLEYLMNNTDCTIMLREHPAQNKIKEFLYCDYEERLPIIKKYPERIRYVKAGDKVNTYQYIQQCKVVLPHTSTMGVEAAMMGKNVILHSHVYYEDIDIAYKAKEKEEYFKIIKYYLEKNNERICKNIDNAYLAYYYQMKRFFPTRFNECFTKWMDYSLIEVNEMQGVKGIIDVITKNISTIYSQIKEEFNHKG